ncbi:MAG: hypothetical protein FJ399_14525, partial [Verrucomicrobia bacterium]|nr:hypothetical protein [Verrucomicrobiota bacterium]
NRPSEQLVARLDQSAEEMDAFDFGRTDYRVCISLREDFLPHLEGLKTIMPALMENRMRLTRMSGTQALDAVIKPGGALVTEEVGRAIVEFVSGARGGSAERLAELDVEPPLLSVICHELNERRRALAQPQITADLVTGNRREILTDFYERSVADLPEGLRLFVEDKLLTKSGYRDSLALETALEEPGVTKPLIDTLVQRRLLRLEDRIGTQRVELTHDVLADVVRASRDARQQRILLQQAQARERAALAAEQHKARRMRFAIAGLVAMVVVLSIGAVFGIRSQRRAVEHASRVDVLLGSRLLDEGRIADGLAYLVSAARKDPANPVIAPRILTTLAGQNFFLPVGRPLDLSAHPVLSATYTGDGRKLVIQSERDELHVIDVASWKVERQLDFGQKVRRRGLRVTDAASSLIAVMLADGSLVVADAATGQPRFSPLRGPETGRIQGQAFAFSPDGRWLAASSATTLWLWDTSTGELRATLQSENRDGWRQVFSFTPDSQRILTVTRPRMAQIWSVPDGAPIGRPLPTQQGDGRGANFSADGSRVFIWRGSQGRVYDTATGAPAGPLVSLLPWAVDQAWLTPDGNRLVHNSDDRTLTVLDVASGKPAVPPMLQGGPVFDGYPSRDGKILFTNSVDGQFRLWDLETGRLVAEPTFRQPHFAPAAFSRDGRQITVFATTGLAHRFRPGPGAAAPLVLPRDPSNVIFVNLAHELPDRLLWFSRPQSRAIAIDVASGREVDGGFALPEPLPNTQGGGVRSAYGMTLGPGQRMVVQPASGWRAWTLGPKGVALDVPLIDMPRGGGGLAQNPFGRFGTAVIVDGEDRAVGVWDLETGRRAAVFKLTEPGGGHAVSPDEELIAIRTNGTPIKLHIHDLESGTKRHELPFAGRAALNAFRFSADSAYLYTGDNWG